MILLREMWSEKTVLAILWLRWKREWRYTHRLGLPPFELHSTVSQSRTAARLPLYVDWEVVQFLAEYRCRQVAVCSNAFINAHFEPAEHNGNQAIVTITFALVNERDPLTRRCWRFR